MGNLKIIASSQNWIDSSSVDSLKKIASFDEVISVVGLPDLSIGGTPNGMAVLTKDNIFPHFIGGDIGCGMSHYLIDSKKFKLQKVEKELNKLDSLDDIRVEDDELGYNLGTIGKGNHFAEFQAVFEIKDKKLFEKYNLKKDAIYLLVHSGSRAFGQIIFNKVSNYNPNEGIDAKSSRAKEYLKSHNLAVTLASKSRDIIAKRVIKASKIGEEFIKISNTAHNSITKIKEGWLHRKGATPIDKGLVIVAGSRGSLSYLLEPIENIDIALYSLSHGAGRKWERSSAKAKLENRYKFSDMLRTKLGSRVVCKDKKLLYEEAPQVYKNIDVVVNDLVEANLAKVVATFKPLLTFKE